jgi:hypothetical protein
VFTGREPGGLLAVSTEPVPKLIDGTPNAHGFGTAFIIKKFSGIVKYPHCLIIFLVEKGALPRN